MSKVYLRAENFKTNPYNSNPCSFFSKYVPIYIKFIKHMANDLSFFEKSFRKKNERFLKKKISLIIFSKKIVFSMDAF